MKKPSILEVGARYSGGRHRRVLTLELNTEEANELARHITGQPLYDQETVDADMKLELELDAEAAHVAEHGDKPLVIDEHTDRVKPAPPAKTE
jgi:hypothetical protein